MSALVPGDAPQALHSSQCFLQFQAVLTVRGILGRGWHHLLYAGRGAWTTLPLLPISWAFPPHATFLWQDWPFAKALIISAHTPPPRRPLHLSQGPTVPPSWES